MTAHDNSITGERTLEQRSYVVRPASDSGGIAALFGSLDTVDSRLAEYPGLFRDPRVSPSLLRGLLVLAVLRNGDLSVTEIGERLGQSTSTVHRYVTTLFAAGLVEQDPRTRRYRLADAGQEAKAR
jgi:DNA-binding transcriptional ArsR family regulator